MERIEELSFDGIARGVPHHGNDAPRRPRRRWPIVLAMALTTLLLACGGAWAYWMWDHHWRLVPVRVNDATFKVRVGADGVERHCRDAVPRAQCRRTTVSRFAP